MMTLKYGGPDPLPQQVVSPRVKSAAIEADTTQARWECRLCKQHVTEAAYVQIAATGRHRNQQGMMARNAGTAYCAYCVDETLRPVEKAHPLGDHERLSTPPDAEPSTMVDVTEARMNLLQHIDGYTAEEEGLFLPDLDAYIVAVRAEAMDQLVAAITAKLTPKLNTGSAMDALILVAEAVRELRAEQDADVTRGQDHA